MSTRPDSTDQTAAERSLQADAESDIGILLTVALAAFKEGLHRHLAKAGYEDLGPGYGFVFRTLGQRSHSLAELAVQLGMTPQGALKIIAEMIDRGYVERRDDADDLRVRQLHLTTRGKAALKEARKYHAGAERTLVAEFGAKPVAATRALLASLAARLPAGSAAEKDARPF
jgi:DNA-binding MarR family transcriptional regulator